MVTGARRTTKNVEKTEKTKKKGSLTPGSWVEARALLWRYRYRLALGLALILASRLSGLVLPAMSGYVVDEVVPAERTGELSLLAGIALVAAVVQSAAGFGLSQVLGVAAQRAITEMRKRVMAHVSRLPIRYFDSTQTGVLISRVMTDAEGIRNLVGTGLVQLAGGLLTASNLARRAVLSELAAHEPDAPHSRPLRRHDGVRLREVAAGLPRAGEDQCRGDRPARRNTRRHPHREGLRRREARATWSSREGRTGCSATSPGR